MSDKMMPDKIWLYPDSEQVLFNEPDWRSQVNYIE